MRAHSEAVQVALGCMRPVHGPVTMSIKEMVSTESGKSNTAAACEQSCCHGDDRALIVNSCLSVSAVGCLPAHVELVLSFCLSA